MKKLFLLLVLFFGNLSFSNANVEDDNVLDVLDTERVQVSNEDLKLVEVDGVDELEELTSPVDANDLEAVDVQPLENVDDINVENIKPAAENVSKDDMKLSERLNEESQALGNYNEEFTMTTAFGDGGVNFLANVIKTSLSTSELVKSAKSLRDSKYAENRLLYKDVYPEVYISKTKSKLKSGLETAQTLGKTDTDEVKLEYKHNLFKSGSDAVMISAASSLNDVADAEYVATQNDIAYDIVKSVYDISLYKSYIINKEVEIKSYQKQYDKIKVKFDQKTASKIDFLEALTALNTAREEKNNLEVILRSHVDTYKRLTGKSTFPDSFGDIYTINALKGKNVNALTRLAYGNSPIIKKLDSYASYYNKVKNSENLKHLPKVDFNAYKSKVNVNKATTDTENKYAGVTITMPLINKMSNLNASLKNGRLETSYRRNVAYEKQRIKQTIETLYRDFMQNDSYANSLFSMAAVKKLQYDKKVIKYVKGLISIDEVIEAKKDQIDILNKVDKAKYDRSLSYWKLVKELNIIVVK